VPFRDSTFGVDGLDFVFHRSGRGFARRFAFGHVVVGLERFLGRAEPGIRFDVLAFGALFVFELEFGFLRCALVFWWWC